LTFPSDAKLRSREAAGRRQIVALESSRSRSYWAVRIIRALLVTARLSNGDALDVTRIARINMAAKLTAITLPVWCGRIADGEGNPMP